MSRMTDKKIIVNLEREISLAEEINDSSVDNVRVDLLKGSLDLINRQQAEIESLEDNLLGVMHSVDKWRDDEELKRDAVNRAAIAREETLKITENQQAEIERLKIESQALKMAANSYKLHYNEAKAEAVKEFAERLKDRIVNSPSAYPI